MKKNLKMYLSVAIVAIAFTTCKKPFTPNVPDANLNVLVVEGVINNATDSTIIHLSRTVNISSVSSIKPELNAVLTVEDEQNIAYTLTDMGKGKYAAPPFTLNAAKKYRLRIKTSDGLIYLSDAEAVKDSPPVDSLGYRITANGLALYVNAHDGNNNTRYYRWQYEEAWKIQMPVKSLYVTDGRKIVPRTQPVDLCYGSSISTNVILASSVKLSQDVIEDQTILLIPPNSDKLSYRYTILVKQYALTKPAYEFWANIQKNTEGLGGVFDQQPSAPTGNIHCTTDPTLPVIGYISIGAVQTKRIFVDKTQLPKLWEYINPYECGLKGYLFYDPIAKTNTVERDLVPKGSFLVPVDVSKADTTITGYTGTSIFCADCTTKGSVTKPAFWK